MHMCVAYLHVLTGCQGRASGSFDNYSDRTVKSLSLFLPFFSFFTEILLLRKPRIIFSPFSFYLLAFLKLVGPSFAPPHTGDQSTGESPGRDPSFPLHIQGFVVAVVFVMVVVESFVNWCQDLNSWKSKMSQGDIIGLLEPQYQPVLLVLIFLFLLNADQHQTSKYCSQICLKNKTNQIWKRSHDSTQ